MSRFQERVFSGVHVDDAVDALVALLQRNEALDSAKVVAEMQVSGRLHAVPSPDASSGDGDPDEVGGVEDAGPIAIPDA